MADKKVSVKVLNMAGEEVNKLSLRMINASSHRYFNEP